MFTQCSKPILQTGTIALSLTGSTASAVAVSLNDNRATAADFQAFSLTAKTAGFTGTAGDCEITKAAFSGPLGSSVALHPDPWRLPQAVLMAGQSPKVNT